jgi:hypothetical protein
MAMRNTEVNSSNLPIRSGMIFMTDNEVEERTDLRTWLEMVDRLRNAPDWAAEDLPVEMIQTHISVVLIGKRRAQSCLNPSGLVRRPLFGFPIMSQQSVE